MLINEIKKCAACPENGTVKKKPLPQSVSALVGGGTVL